MLLKIILEEEIFDVKVHTEHSILYNSDFRSIRLDVYACKAEGAVYSIMLKQVRRNVQKKPGIAG